MIALLAAGSILAGLPSLPPLPEIRREPSITYVDRSGLLLGVRGGQIPPPVDLARLPRYVPAAFVSIEDRRFYEHAGFDAIGMARALVADISRGRTAQGASTITQQLARNLFLSQDQTVERKTRELMLAVQLEQKFTKQQILGLYLSRVYFGSGATGIEAASWRYFNKPAAKLTVREAAALAGILKAPSDYNPVDNPERSAQRSALVLDAMVQTGAITPAQRAKALAQHLKVYRDPPTASAQYFVDWADQQTRAVVGKPKQDLVVQTTLDLPLELAAAAQTKAVVARHAGQKVEQAALVAVDGVGHVRALVGGVDYRASAYDRAVLARRQTGSSWKPFVYLTALEAGRTPETQVVDEPVTIGSWSPHNFENAYLGPITLEKALAESVNTVAARLADEVGRDKVAATARRLGVTSPINTGPAMALGANGVTPLEMAQAYGAFSNGGRRVTAYAIDLIRTRSGAVLYQHRAPPRPLVIQEPALSQMNRMLRAVVASGTGVHAAIAGRDVAGKTGTTSDYKDAWFCGYTGGFATVVWMGRDDGSPMRGVTGGSAPAELWRGFMLAALPRVSATAIPAGVAPALLPPVQPVTAAATPADLVAGLDPAPPTAALSPTPAAPPE